MNNPSYAPLLFVLGLLLTNCTSQPAATDKTPENSEPFPSELVNFTPYAGNPVFSGTGTDTWDTNIRERGWIMREADGWHMWYTGYRNGPDEKMALGYASSPDGLNWTRFSDSPIFDTNWTEDMMIVKWEDTYYMFAEGQGDIAHLLTSADKIHWEDHGSLDVRQTNGDPISPGPYGTPTALRVDSLWYLLYERGDLGIWLATSPDLVVWTNMQDEPVLEMGPEPYDLYGLAVNQVVEYNGRYYAYFHGTSKEDWSLWSTNVAMSEDLIHWQKYPGNPIAEDNKSSGILVHDGTQYLLYTMHEKVQVHYPADTTYQSATDPSESR